MFSKSWNTCTNLEKLETNYFSNTTLWNNNNFFFTEFLCYTKLNKKWNLDKTVKVKPFILLLKQLTSLYCFVTCKHDCFRLTCSKLISWDLPDTLFTIQLISNLRIRCRDTQSGVYFPNNTQWSQHTTMAAVTVMTSSGCRTHIYSAWKLYYGHQPAKTWVTLIFI